MKHTIEEYQEALRDVGNLVGVEQMYDGAVMVSTSFDNNIKIIQELIDRLKPKKLEVYDEEFDGWKYQTYICPVCGCKVDEQERPFCQECGEAVEVSKNDTP